GLLVQELVGISPWAPEQREQFHHQLQLLAEDLRKRVNFLRLSLICVRVIAVCPRPGAAMAGWYWPGWSCWSFCGNVATATVMHWSRMNLARYASIRLAKRIWHQYDTLLAGLMRSTPSTCRSRLAGASSTCQYSKVLLCPRAH